MIADWMLERYRLGELNAEDQARVTAALAADEALRLRLTLAVARRRFLENP